MGDIIQIPYSKNFAFIACAILIALIVFLAWGLFKLSAQADATAEMIVFSIMELAVLFLFFYLIKKYFVPALHGQTAIELNKDGITDNTRNNKISWDNVSNLRLVRGRGSSFVAIDLKNDKKLTSQTRNIFKKLLFRNNTAFYGTPVLIPTQYIKGSDTEVFNLILSYFRQIKNCT